MKPVAGKAVAKPVPPVPKPVPPVAKPEPEKAGDLAATPVEAPSVGTAYNGAAWGMIGGGLALGGLGTYLVMGLDGQITCPEGTRRECPTVYNAKGLGLVAFGTGAALIGAGSALLFQEWRRGQSTPGVAVGAVPTADGAFLNVAGEF